MKIILCDDEKMALEEIEDVVKEVHPSDEIFRAINYLEALDIANKERLDVAFLDINMPGMTGLELAKQLMDLQPNLNVVFVTAYSEYAIHAFSMYASGYLLKPVQKKDVEDAFDNLRNPIQYDTEKLRVQCFGNFEVFYKNQIVDFSRVKMKELFAYLINLRGATATTDELCAVLWEEDSKSNKSYLRNIVAYLVKVLKEIGMEQVFIHNRNAYAVDVEQIECDYYKFLDGDVAAINSYQGGFMNQYSWAEMTTGYLDSMKESK